MQITRVLKGVRLILEGEGLRLLRLLRPSADTDSFLSKSFEARSTRTELAEYFRLRSALLFFIDPSRKEECIKNFRAGYAPEVDTVVQSADSLLDHRFSMLGVEEVALGTVIDWHSDFKSGARWNPRTYYKLVGKIPKPPGADIKIPWELSRFQHVATLGKAYWLTQDEKYAREFVDQITHWISRNPPQFGVNWSCTMDVAIRVTNWIWGWYFFKDSPSLDEQFVQTFLSSLSSHGDHIMNNLEILSFEGKEYKNNHYLSDVVGLVYLGLMFPELRNADEWISKGLQGLEEEMTAQVCEDGVSFEMSIPYHRLALELFLYPAILCRLNGVQLSSAYFAKLERMLEFTAAYTKPDGLAPQIGDADDGRLHILGDYSNWERRDHRYLLSAGAELFDREDFRTAAGQPWEEAFWLTDRGRRESSLPVATSGLPEALTISRAFASSSYYIMRAGENFMAINATTVGTGGLGGHKHCDVLSFELGVGETTFLIDPGTYAYTSDAAMRNLFRSTAYHNTVQVDGQEQNHLDESNLFLMREAANPVVHEWESNVEYDYFDGEHTGYCRLDEPIVHRRQIYFDKEESFWVIRDTLASDISEKIPSSSNERDNLHSFDQYFHFAPMDVGFVEGPHEISRKCRDVLETRFGIPGSELICEYIIRATSKNGQTLIGIPLLATQMERDLSTGWVSIGYGVKEKAPIVRLHQSGKGAQFLTVFVLAE